MPMRAAAALLLVATPVAAQHIQAITPSDRAQGEAANPQLVKQFGGAYRGPQAAFVERVGKRVAVQSGLSDTAGDFTVTLLDSPIENAFAIPGGYIYVTRQLLALMTSEAELASVLGHEVGHVAARHAAGRNTRSTIGSILAAGAGIATGSDIAQRIVGTGAKLYTLRYGRNQEYQADALGVRYIAAAGYDPYASADILSALEDSTTLEQETSGAGSAEVPGWASTHPNSEERGRRAAQLAVDTGRPETKSGQDTVFLRMLDGLPYGAAKDRLRIRIVAVGARDTIDSLAARMAVPQLKRERFLVLNGMSGERPLTPGTLVKLVVAA